ncbi:MAG TPA: SLC13 family permease, partial [Chthoniobacterales bacterium]
MTIAFVLSLLVIAMILFATEKLSVDLITFLMLLALLFTGILTPQEAFAGFGSDIILILGSVFVISGAMRETGVVDWVGDALSRFAKGGKNPFLTLMMGSVSGLSAFMNNTTVTALMLTPVIGMARRRKISASKLLMPMAFASILGGTCTLIGTSTNVAVSGFLTQSGERPIGFFELTPIGLLIVAIGILYMRFFGQKLLPDHAPVQELTEDYGLREYLSEILIRENSPLAGQPLSHSDLGKMDFRVLRVIREGKSLAPHPRLKLAAGDLLLVNGAAESLMKVRETEGIEIKADFKFGDKALTSDRQQILELIVTPHSTLRGRRIMDLDLPARQGIVVLAINRHGQHL